VLARDAEICQAIKGILQGRVVPNMEIFYRLRTAGLVIGESAKDAQLRSLLYRTYLARHLV